MAQTRTFQITERGGSTAGSVTISVSAEGADQREVNLPPATTDKEVDIDFVYTRLKSLMMRATGVPDGTTITIKTNSSGAPDDTLTFITPGSISYAVDANGANLTGAANPITADVTRVYLSNPDTSNTAAFWLSALYDPTP